MKIRCLFSVYGRDDRWGYFRAVCIAFGYAVASILLAALTMALAEHFWQASFRSVEIFKLLASALIGLPMCWMTVAAQVRRIRDTGVSGWWYLAAVSIVPLAMYFATGHVQHTELELTIIRLASGLLFFSLFAIPTDFFDRSQKVEIKLPAPSAPQQPRDRLAEQLNSMRNRNRAAAQFGGNG
jgi:uncharacterized membrane protein YhaH (DUF805 family)